MRILSSAVASLAMLLGFSSQGFAWEAEYLPAQTASQISTCNASQTYRNAFFTVRVYGDDLDFIFFRNDFTLPYGKILGPVGLNFGDDLFVAIGSTNSRRPEDYISTSQTLFLEPKGEDYAKILSDLRNRQRLDIIFPDGTSYKVDLFGSAAAIAQVMECWKRNPTGPMQNNPFTTPQGKNPFETPNSNGAQPNGTQTPPAAVVPPVDPPYAKKKIGL